jgi:predicted lipoprotein with Yx(FWY)xxD motif
MTNQRISAAISVSGVVLALLVAGCGSDDSGTSSASGEAGGAGAYGSTGSAPKPASGSGAEGAATVAVATVPKLGKVIVDADGFTLYDFHKDKGTRSSCYGGCAKLWPPLLTDSTPKASGGVSAGKLGTSPRSDGTTQVTFASHPLYTYAADQKPGEANGNDIDSFGAEWYALEPSGAEPED